MAKLELFWRIGNAWGEAPTPESKARPFAGSGVISRNPYTTGPSFVQTSTEPPWRAVKPPDGFSNPMNPTGLRKTFDSAVCS